MASSEVNVVREQVWSDAVDAVGDMASATLVLVTTKRMLDSALETMSEGSAFREPLEDLLLSAELAASMVMLLAQDREENSDFNAVWDEFQEALHASG